MAHTNDPTGGVAPGALSALLAELASPGRSAGRGGQGLRPGAVVGRFEIVRELGRGGFGVVYEARDRELGRPVAFKALAAGGSAAVREERLLREAEAAARLSHPNVVTLYDVGRDEHGPYLVLELLRGKTLGRRLEAGPLSVAEAHRIALHVARGLAHAHAQGVVHRDLTPGNVFLCDDGQVKVLDLGMAHAFGRRRVDGGTTAYMAPEQERGAPEDERTDVFALGVLLYRMLAGDVPPVADPAPALDVRELPALGALVARMLARDPVDRPRDAGEVAATLEALQLEGARAARSPSAVHVEVRPASAASVAVLPFDDLSPAHDQGWLCDGLAEEILHGLGGLAGLRVASRAASFHFKATATDAREVARALGVTTLLEGSVRKAGPRVRITARLAGADGYEIWSETFDRVIEDVFAVQEEIAQAVVRGLRVQLSSGEVRRLQRTGTRSPEAYELYLRARHIQHGAGPWRAAELLRRALDIDPAFAEAHAALAHADFFLLQWRIAEDDALVRAEALAASERALRIDPALAEAHVARANLLTLSERGVEAEEEYQRALALNPGLADAWYFYGRFLFAAGRLAEAARAFEEATRRDPEDYFPISLLPQVYRSLGDEDRERSAIRRAIAAAERWLRFTPDDVRAMYLLATNYLRAGEGERGHALMARALLLEPEDFGLLYNAACFHAQARDVERALELLDRAVATGRGHRPWIEHDSDLDVIRSDPRFARILERLPP